MARVVLEEVIDLVKTLCGVANPRTWLFLTEVERRSEKTVDLLMKVISEFNRYYYEMVVSYLISSFFYF
jgi:hypothetical protein